MFGDKNNMPLCKVESIEVVGNVLDEHEKLRREKLVYVRGKPENINSEMICPKCNENMESPMGLYNGFTDIDDDGICLRTYSWECKNFHHMGWTDLI